MMTILRNSLSATVLIVVIVLVRAAALQKLPKNTFCVLWIGAALRLLLPVSIESEYSFFTFLNGLLRKSGGDMGTIAGTIHLEEAQGQIENASGGRIPILEVLWLTGVCVMTVFFLISFIRSVRRFRRSTPVDDECRDYLPAKRLFPVKIRQSEEITGPLTYGFFRPVILLPRATDWEDSEKLTLILAHECAHIRRYDCLAKLLFVAALCVHWFNPAVWLLCLLASRDIELACDEETIRSLGAENRFLYARALLCQTEHMTGAFPLFSHFGTQGIGERIASVLRPRRRSVWCTVAACLLVLGILTFFGTGPARNPEAEAAVPESTSGDVLPQETVTTDSMFVSKPGDAPQEAVRVYSMLTTRTNGSLPNDYSNFVFGIGFSSSDPAETCSLLQLKTPDGKAYVLKSDQYFSFQLNAEVLQQGVVNGSVYEFTPDEEPILVTQAFAEVRVISQDPLVVEVCGEKLTLSE